MLQFKIQNCNFYYLGLWAHTPMYSMDEDGND